MFGRPMRLSRVKALVLPAVSAPSFAKSAKDGAAEYC
jgi:hypothetical protein